MMIVRAVLLLVIAYVSVEYACAQQTFNSYVQGLGAAGTLTGSELLYGVQGGASKQITINQISAESQQAFNSYVQGLQPASALTGSELLYGIQSGASKQITLNQIISTPLTVGDLVVAGPGSAQVQDSSACSGGLCAIPSGISYTGNLSYAGAATPGWFKEDGHTVSGVSSSASGCCLGLNAFRLYIGSDTVDASTPGTFSEMVVIDAPAAGHKGYRTAISGYLETVGSPGAGSNNNYVGVLGQNRANVNLGGTTFSSYSAGTNQSGSLFGMNSNVFAQSGATFLVNITSQEFDVSLPTGASSAEKHAITVIKSAADAVQGNFDDSAIEFDDQDGTSVGWNFGISFGAYAHKWSFTSSSTLIGIQNRVVPSPASSPANIGVDMTNGTFTTAQFKGTGFLVDPSGNVTGNAYKVGGTAGVTCSGTPTASFAATSGIVTHC